LNAVIYPYSIGSFISSSARHHWRIDVTKMKRRNAKQKDDFAVSNHGSVILHNRLPRTQSSGSNVTLARTTVINHIIRLSFWNRAISIKSSSAFGRGSKQKKPVSARSDGASIICAMAVIGLVAVGLLGCGFMFYVLVQWMQQTVRKD
jgi:hypothetical protein